MVHHKSDSTIQKINRLNGDNCIYKWLNYVELNAWASIRIVNRKLSFSISLPTTTSTQDAGKFCTLTTLSHQGCQHSCQPATVCAQSFFARLCFFTSFVYLPTRCDPAASCNMSSPGTCILSFELNRLRPSAMSLRNLDST